MNPTQFFDAFSDQQIEKYLSEFLYSLVASKEFIQKTEEERVDLVFFLMQLSPVLKELNDSIAHKAAS